MRSLLFSACTALLCLTTSATFAADPTLEEILAQNLEARGGQEAIDAIKTMRATGKMSMGPMEMPMQLEAREPGQIRMEFTMQGMTAIQAYDGKQAWQIMPFMGKPDPEAMGPDEAKQIKDNGDIKGDLINWKAKGHKVSLVGKETLEGTEVWKLKIDKASGDTVYAFLDAEYFLEIAQQAKVKVQGQEMETSTTIGDYKEVAGVQMAHSVIVNAKTPMGEMKQAITIDKVEVNVDFPADHFSMPKVEPKPAADAPAKP